MKLRRRISGICGLCLVVVLAMAGWAAGAQAAEWVIKTETLEELGKKEESTSGSGAKAFTFTFATAAEFHVKCEAQSISGTIVEATTGTAVIKMTKCTTTNKEGKTLPSCAPAEPIELKTKILLSEVEKAIYLKFAPQSGKALFFLSMGEACALGEKFEVTGEMAGKFEEGELKEKLIPLSKEISSKAKTELKSGSALVSPEGEFKLSLAGVHAGATWGQVNLATSICSVKKEVPCGAPNTWAKNSAIEAAIETGTKAKLSGGTVFTECPQSAIIGETTNIRAQPLPVTISTFSFGGCENTCEVKASSAGPSAALRMIAAEPGNGRLSMLNPRVEIECAIPFVHCKYGSINAVVDVLGGEPTAKIKAFEEELGLEATIFGSCPSLIKWNGNYKISAVAPIFVSR
jgi:hypothetical protein